MTIFQNPADHASNPPESWVVEPDRLSGGWCLRTKDFRLLQSAKTQEEAESFRTNGFLALVYEREGRWFAGEHMPGIAPYVPWGEPRKPEHADLPSFGLLNDMELRAQSATGGGNWVATEDCKGDPQNGPDMFVVKDRASGERIAVLDYSEPGWRDAEFTANAAADLHITINTLRAVRERLEALEQSHTCTEDSTSDADGRVYQFPCDHPIHKELAPVFQELNRLF